MTESRATWRAQFFGALYDDLDAPRAVAVLWCILADASLTLGERARLIADLGGVLGLAWTATRAAQPTPDVLHLLAQRETARSARDFSKADALRAELSKRGFSIEDGADGPQLHRTR